MMFARLCVAALVMLPTMALAAHQHSMEDEMACTGDVYRLCAAKIPDEDAIVVCLKQNKLALSPPCRAVFSRPDTSGDNQPSDNN